MQISKTFAKYNSRLNVVLDNDLGVESCQDFLNFEICHVLLRFNEIIRPLDASKKNVL